MINLLLSLILTGEVHAAPPQWELIEINTTQHGQYEPMLPTTLRITTQDGDSRIFTFGQPVSEDDQAKFRVNDAWARVPKAHD